jgi:hypothetical protein
VIIPFRTVGNDRFITTSSQPISLGELPPVDGATEEVIIAKLPTGERRLAVDAGMRTLLEDELTNDRAPAASVAEDSPVTRQPDLLTGLLDPREAPTNPGYPGTG